MSKLRHIAASIALLFCLALPAHAGTTAELLALEPHPGVRLPLDALLLDEAGQTVTLRQFFTGAPVILVFEYLRCRTICGLALGSLADALAALPPVPQADIRVIAISMDPRLRVPT